MATELIVATFKGNETAANEYMVILSRWPDWECGAEVYTAAAASKNAKGHVTVKHVEGEKHGALFGSIVGGTLGFALGPAGVVAGGAIGAGIGKFITRDHPDKYGVSKEMGESLKDSIQPGDSMMVIAANPDTCDRLIRELESLHAEVTHQTLDVDHDTEV